MASEVMNSAGNEIRENLVTTAVQFLSNPNVQRCTLESKERFLRGKGLTDLEIQKAIAQYSEKLDLSSVTDFMYIHTRKNWIKDHVIPLLMYGGFAYGCYWFYKNYIKHLVFVEQPKKKSTAEYIDELRKSLDILNANVTSLRGEMLNANQTQPINAMRLQLDNVKSEIASVKGMLLNRNQFPSLKSRTEPPSIPAWQLQAEAASTVVVEEKKKRRGQRSESGGSNSSEGEQATKNSDSSLEIIS